MTVQDSLVFASCEIKANALVRYAILDKNVIVEEGVRIEGTPDNPVVIAKSVQVTSDVIGG